MINFFCLVLVFWERVGYLLGYRVCWGEDFFFEGLGFVRISGFYGVCRGGVRYLLCCYVMFIILFLIEWFIWKFFIFFFLFRWKICLGYLMKIRFLFVSVLWFLERGSSFLVFGGRDRRFLVLYRVEEEDDIWDFFVFWVVRSLVNFKVFFWRKGWRILVLLVGLWGVLR